MRKFLRLKAVFEIFLIISLSVIISLELGSLFSPSVKAENNVCCEKTIGGELCKYTNEASCKLGNGLQKYMGACDRAPFCKPVCCDANSKNQGCFSSTGRQSCLNAGGVPVDDASCNIPQCKKACCVVGDQCSLQTEQACSNSIKNYPALELDFREDVTSQIQCNNICNENRNIGCCVKEGICSSKSEGMCTSDGGRFYYNLCSAMPEGKCEICKGEKVKKCIDGSPDVYEFDSCNNKERVADTCDYQNGEVCSVIDDVAQCNPGKCKGVWDKPYVIGATKNPDAEKGNFEGWCVGESFPGSDLPGSRQWKHYCLDGVEKRELCDRESGKICWQVNDGDKSTANCVKFNTDGCGKLSKEACTNNDQHACAWVEGANLCLPIAPVAVDAQKALKDPEAKVCNNPSISKNFEALWELFESHVGEEIDCNENCYIYTPDFAVGLNSLCNKYGDCGANYNTVGQFSSQGFIRKTNKESICYDEDCAYGGDDAVPGEVEEEDFVEQYGVKFEKFDDQNIGVKTMLDMAKDYVDEETLKDYFDYLKSQDSKQMNFVEFYNSIFKFDKWAYGGTLRELEDSLGLRGVDTFDYGSLTNTLAGVAAAGLSIAIATAGEVGLISCLGSLGLGCVIGAAILLLAGIAALILWMYEDIKGTVNVMCNGWQAPPGGDYCYLCNDEGLNAKGEKIDLTLGGLHYCTDYLCHSLGQGCDIIETDQGKKCVNAGCSSDSGERDTAWPLIVPDIEYLKKNLVCSDTNDPFASASECRIKPNEQRGYTIENYIKMNTNVPIAIKTCKGVEGDECEGVEYANCRLDKKRNDEDINKLAYGFLNSESGTVYTTSHKRNLTAAGDDLIAGDYNYYIRCIDKCGNPGPSYEVKFTVGEGIKTQTPSLRSISPEAGSYFPFELNKTNVDIAVDQNLAGKVKDKEGKSTEERAGCRYDILDMRYDDMKHKLDCSELPISGGDQKCTAIDVNLTLDKNIFFIKCKNLFGYSNSDSLVEGGYKLTRAPSLNISTVNCITPFGSKCDKIYFSNFTLSVVTEKGADNGKAKCGLSSGNVLNVGEAEMQFGEGEFVDAHSLDIGPLEPKDYSYWLVCEDKAKNIEKLNINFTIAVDKDAPVILSVWRDGGSVKVRTNEISTCRYTAGASYDFTNSTEFSNLESGLLHSASVDESVKKLAIVCEDRFTNANLGVNVYPL